MFTIIFYYHAVMNTFIQWQETISDAFLTYTPSYFPFIEPNTSLLPQGSLASRPSKALIYLEWPQGIEAKMTSSDVNLEQHHKDS